MYCDIRYGTYLNTILYNLKLLNCSWYIDTVLTRWRHFKHTYSMLCTWSAVAYLVINYYKFKSQNTYSLKINFGKEKKNHQPEKKKTIINYARNVHVLRHTLWNIVEHYVVRSKSLKPAVGTLIQYLFDRDTFIIRIQCCVLEVP